MEHLKALCVVLELSLDDAVMGAPKEAKTAEEQVMLDLFRSSDDQGRQFLLVAGQQARKTGK
jgi:hypothetical protein